MPALPFQIEVVLPERSLVIARRLEPIPFLVEDGTTTLGGREVSLVVLPRARAADGSLRTDVFGFRLLFPEDAAQLRPGDVVELAGWRPTTV